MLKDCPVPKTKRHDCFLLSRSKKRKQKLTGASFLFLAFALFTERLPLSFAANHRQPGLTRKSKGNAHDTRKSIHSSSFASHTTWTSLLHPLETLRIQKQRKLNNSETSTSYWFEPEQNAVYATIPDPLDPLHGSNRRLLDFHASRHYSRYEHHYRKTNQIAEDSPWNGKYDDQFFDLITEEPVNSSDISSMLQHPRRRRRLTESKGPKESAQLKNGGQYNNYQAVPLSQGYGTHYAAVWIGSPTPQRKTVIVDTGSHYTAFPCTGCRNCGAPHHTDPYYKPEKSESFHQLQCSECQDGVGCVEGKCRFSQAYTEGSSWDAIQVQDRFYCGGTDVLDSVNPNDSNFAINFMFGCQSSLTGLFRTQLADGIMGMSAHPATFPKKLFDEGKIEHNMFAMCYRRELGTSKRGVTAGSMTFGGVSNNLDTSPMVYAKNIAKVGWFTVFVKNIYVRTTGGQSARSIDTVHRTIKVKLDVKTLNSGKGVIVDSGTTDTYLNKKVAKEFTKAWKRATGQAYSHTPMTLTAEELRSLPTILIQCQAFSRDADPSITDYDSIPGFAGSLDPYSPKDLLIAIPATSYMDYSPITKRYMSRLYFTETVGGVLGSNTMQGHNVLFDWQNGRVGFAESSCSYDKKDIPKISQDPSFATDCKIGETILTKPCIEDVDRRVCKLNPTSIAMLGKEMWTVRVESPGNEAGVSCVEASLGLGGSGNKLDDPVLSCNGHGVCEEERPCQLTCAEALKAADIVPVQAAQPSDAASRCSDFSWSACDYGCMQTKIQSRLFTDGLCHEIKRETRKCHIGACARSDPCRVPFIVHTTMAFRDGSVKTWSRESEEILSRALVSTIGLNIGEEFFSVGDVNVAMVLPWYQDQDEFDSMLLQNSRDTTTKDYGHDFNSQKLGLKVVVEVSMYNAMVDAVNRSSVVENSFDENEGTLTSMLRNISSRVRNQKAPTLCFQEELYPLAKKALRVKEAFLEPNFMDALIEEIQLTSQENDREAFGPVDAIGYNASASFLVSAWTIRTGVEDDVNFLGPQKPLTAKIVVFLQNTIILSFAFFFLMIAWSCALTAYDFRKGSTVHNQKFLLGGESWHHSEGIPGDREEAFIMDGPGDFELSAYKITRLKTS